MSFTTRSIILVFILTTILVVSALLENNNATEIEGFKPKDPFKELKKIGGFFKKIEKFFKKIGDFFVFLGKIIKCSVETLIGLPSCILFYLIDLFLGIIGMIIKLLCSFSPHLEKARLTTWKIIKKLDGMIYKLTRFRIIEYPNSILKKCYKCRSVKIPKF